METTAWGVDGVELELELKLKAMHEATESSFNVITSI